MSHAFAPLMTPLAGFALVLAGLGGSASAAAGTVVLQDDFSRDQGWSAPDAGVSASFENGQLTVANSNPKLKSSATVSRPFLLAAAASYRVSVDIAVIRQEGESAFAGVDLVAPSGDSIAVTLSTKDQNIRVSYWYRGEWVKSIMPWTLAESMKSEPGAVNTIRVESKGGLLMVAVNDVVVGRTRVIDFFPTSIALGGGELFTARYDNLSITETGVDSRLARLQLLAPVPGQRLLAYDDFKSYSTTGKLMSLVRRNKDDQPDWGESWDNARSRSEIDASRQRMVIEARTSSAWRNISSYAPMPYAGYAVAARLDLLTLASGNDCAGIEIDGSREHNGTRDQLLACVSQTEAMLVYFDAAKDEWQWLARAALALPQPKSADIRMTVNNGQVLMFVDGRLHLSADKPAGFEYFNAGIRIDAAQKVEVLEFKASEL